MSTSYEFFGRGKREVTWKVLLSTPGVKEHRTPQSKATERCLKMGDAHLWAYGDRKFVSGFERYGGNVVHKMVNEIAKHTKVKIRSEHGAKYPLDDGFCAILRAQEELMEVIGNFVQRKKEGGSSD